MVDWDMIRRDECTFTIWYVTEDILLYRTVRDSVLILGKFKSRLACCPGSGNMPPIKNRNLGADDPLDCKCFLLTNEEQYFVALRPLERGIGLIDLRG